MFERVTSLMHRGKKTHCIQKYLNAVSNYITRKKKC